MNPDERLRGVMAATLTPFDALNRIDIGAIRAHTDFLIEGGISAVCPGGTTGEMLYLSAAEKVRLIEATCSTVRGRVPVVAGIWGLREAEVALLGRAARACGAHAVFLPPPIYYPASQAAIYRWYAHARESSELRVFAYNIPGYAANNISLDCLEQLTNDGVIAGIKDSTGKSEQMSALVGRFSDRLSVEAASDGFVDDARRIGAHGFISALANVWPRTLVRLWEGESALQQPVAAVRAAVKEAGGIPAVKFLAGLRGFPCGQSRIPFSLLTEQMIHHLEAAYKEAESAGLE